MAKHKARSQPIEQAESVPLYSIELTTTAEKMLAELRDKRTQKSIARRIDELAKSPEQLGKDLTGELTGYRSIRAAGQRYRIIYRVEREKIVVCVVALGLRREGSRDDVYSQAQRLLRSGLLN